VCSGTQGYEGPKSRYVEAVNGTLDEWWRDSAGSVVLSWHCESETLWDWCEQSGRAVRDK
jgi:hypothetical protein